MWCLRWCGLFPFTTLLALRPYSAILCTKSWMKHGYVVYLYPLLYLWSGMAVALRPPRRVGCMSPAVRPTSSIETFCSERLDGLIHGLLILIIVTSWIDSHASGFISWYRLISPAQISAVCRGVISDFAWVWRLPYPSHPKNMRFFTCSGFTYPPYSKISV